MNDYKNELYNIVQTYSNTPESHRSIWEEFWVNTNSIKYLKDHRDYVERNIFGYGDRPFHYMWNLLVGNLEDNFKFLEIGVFKGQVLSLVGLVAKKQGKSASIFGVTPLDSSGDHYSNHPDIDYIEAVYKIFDDFQVSRTQLRLIKGYSQDKKVMNTTEKYGPYDVVYVDGCHDYEVVLNDLKIYPNMLRKGGYLIVDDASNYLSMPDMVSHKDASVLKIFLKQDREVLFAGIEVVSRAVSETVESDGRFSHLFACGHNRVWRKVR